MVISTRGGFGKKNQITKVEDMQSGELRGQGPLSQWEVSLHRKRGSE